ncbi:MULTISPECIES: hypothetical protein [unclassified Pedobacter]|uniref:hypothetical protein n=1 Tax=unclassified Pedobacter TaxID=2628915 RepID=UPI001D7F05C1|nr:MULTISPECIES: hypothetical protein [unclassified Pedobacter]CAH0277395.1 hypothetical protein SRABI36_03919 [Pedobacter sp. Bi36]CAH0294709.1 hypothetical protein SRABI126_04165 [Pedobacter sp. Bi126]
MKNTIKLSALTLFYIFFLVTISQAQTRDNAGLQGDAGAVSGFFDTVNPINYPAGAGGWWHLLDVRHSNPANNYAMQFAGGFYDQHLYFRKVNNNPSQPWLKVVTESEGKVVLNHLTTTGDGNVLNQGNANDFAGNLLIRANTGGRFEDKGAQIEFVIPGNTDGSNPWGQGRIITVAGNGSNSNATGKMILGTRRMFNKYGSSQQWFYGDDIVIDGIGNIGMGTLTPREKLSVNGNIRAREIKIESTNWPDYVFEEGYNIGTLKGLENYIKTNKHLPEMPSAKEVETNGIAVSEILKLQQKKIEELTLHLIEKDKQLSTQGGQVTKLEAKLIQQDKILQEILKKLK